MRRYAASPHTRISVLSFFDFKTKRLFSLHDESIALIPNCISVEDREFLKEVFTDPELTIIAHNASFEQTVLEAKLNKFLADNAKLDVNCCEIPKYICTMTWANILRSPAKLEDAAKFFNLEIQKDTKGSALMRKVASPMKENTVTGVVNGIPYVRVEMGGNGFKGGPDVYERMVRYCEQDVKATLKLYNYIATTATTTLGDFFDFIRAGARLNEAMNNKGVRVDLELLEKLEYVTDVIFDKADEVVAKYFEVESADKRNKIIAALNDKGVMIKKLGKQDIKKYLQHNKVDPFIKEGLELYTKYNTTSLKKVKKAKDTNKDGYLYGLFKYCGAYATGRWTSFDFQLQNMPRSTQSCPEEAVKFINENWQNKEVICEYPEKFIDGIRALIQPDKGKKFYITDLSGIEARVALHMAGYQDILSKMYTGELDVYVELAKNVLGKDTVTKEERQNIGKPGHLGGQFGQSAPSLKEYAEGMGSVMTADEAAKTTKVFRQKYRKIAEMWWNLDSKIKQAYVKGEEFKVKLASGRYVNYGKIEKVTRKCTHKTKKECKDNRCRSDYKFNYTTLCYNNGKTLKSIYGSYVFQNMVQAEARDILLFKMLNMANLGYDIRMTIHDEVVIQVDPDVCKDTLDSQWANAGMMHIEELWEGLQIDSESVILGRYWSH